jgi:hypothetical protein
MKDPKPLQTIGGAEWPRTLKALERLSDEQLKEYHDALVGSQVRRPVGIEYYLGELARRRQGRLAARMVWLTWAIAGMTLVNVAVAIALYLK